MLGRQRVAKVDVRTIEDPHADRMEPAVAKQGEDAGQEQGSLAETRTAVQHERLVARGASGHFRDIVIASGEREPVAVVVWK